MPRGFVRVDTQVPDNEVGEMGRLGEIEAKALCRIDPEARARREAALAGNGHNSQEPKETLRSAPVPFVLQTRSSLPNS
jgi:hypothetical protein